VALAVPIHRGLDAARGRLLPMLAAVLTGVLGAALGRFVLDALAYARVRRAARPWFRTVVTAVVALVPLLGTPLIWVPAAARIDPDRDQRFQQRSKSAPEEAPAAVR